MFKLMIADDNPYILNELCEIVDWEDYNLNLIGAFPNGKALLTAAQKDLPDIVITDISMPIMNGIELSSALRLLSPNIKIVFVSCYPDFDYAQKAIKLHISDYLLKPFDLPQLSDVITKLVHTLCDERLQKFEHAKQLHQADTYRRLAIESYINELLYQSKDDNIIRSHLQELDLSLPEPFRMRVAHITLPQNIEHSYTNSINIFRSIIQQYNAPLYDLIPFHLNPADFSVLILYQDSATNIDTLLAQIHIDIETALNLNTVIGYSQESSSLSVFATLFQQATLAASPENSLHNSIIEYEDIQSNTRKHSDTPPVSGLSNYVQQMQEYIHAHYMTDITTGDVAASVFLSSSYANQCFSAECNCSIFDYITRCRIEQAKKLLTETDEKVTVIAEAVGYSGKTSFYLSFKRNVGLSPTEYRSTRST